MYVLRILSYITDTYSYITLVILLIHIIKISIKRNFFNFIILHIHIRRIRLNNIIEYKIKNWISISQVFLPFYLD